MKTLLLILAAALIAALPAVATAEIVIGDATNDMLLVADPATGELTEHCSVGTPHIVSLAYDPGTGTAYCSDTSEGVNQILEIDVQTGATSMVVQVPDFFTVIHSTAVDPATGELYAIDQEHGHLYRVDIAAGELIFVGAIGVFWLTGADFDPVSGELYVCVGGMDASGALYTVDTATGASTFVASTHRLMGLAFDDDGNLYGVNNSWYPDDPGLYSIDKNTGAWEELGTYPGRNTMSIESIPLDVVRVLERSLTGVKRLFE
jgi:DNA-binding beta-propeller fold protein YncE